MGRIYYVNTGFQTVASASMPIDLLEITAGTEKPFVVHEVTVSQSSDFGDTEAEQIRIAVKRATGAFSSGTGGASATTVKGSLSDSAAGFTAERNNTTQASGGTIETLVTEAVPVQAGYQRIWTPETRPTIQPTDALIVSIEGSLADDLTMTATAIIEEL